MALTESQLRKLRRAPVPEPGNRVQTAIDLTESTQTATAKAIELPHTYVSDVARGRFQTITVENATKFSQYFGCRIEDLFPAKEAVAS
jgi:plasmid maintenance system antidote protein VapI